LEINNLIKNLHLQKKPPVGGRGVLLFLALNASPAGGGKVKKVKPTCIL
jgi:hypothetical protein